MLYIPEENFACASSKIMAHSVDCNMREDSESMNICDLHAHMCTHMSVFLTLKLVCLTMGKRLAMSSSVKGALEEKS